MNDDELISQTFLSQAKLTRNSSNKMTYTQISLGVSERCSDINNTVLIHNIKRYGDQIKMKSFNKFKCLFENHVRSLGETDYKLMLYGKVKRQYSYETYLDSDCYDLRYLVKFKMSIHGFPIERGRYNKPKIRKSIRARGKVIIFRFSYFLSRNIDFYNSKFRLS